MSLHINKVEAKVKTVTARIMQLTSDVTLKNVENVSTIKLIENTINSILLYGMEAIVLKKRDIDKLDSIQYNAIRNLFTLPWATPKGIMRTESGIMSLEMQIKWRQFEYIHSIMNGKQSLQKTPVESIPYWMKTYNKLKNRLNLHHCTEEHNNDQLKNMIKKAIAGK